MLLSQETREKLSLNMPPEAVIIVASPHTIRMLPLVAHNFDQETQRSILDRGIHGYLWGLTVMGDGNLPHGIFAFKDVTEKTLPVQVDCRSLEYIQEYAPKDSTV